MNGYMSLLIIIAYLVRGYDVKFVEVFNMARFSNEGDYLKPIAMYVKNIHIPRYKHEPIRYINNPEVSSQHKLDIRRNDDIDLANLSPNKVHEYKVKQVADFIMNRRLTANYFYEEMKRIKRQHKVKDDLRKMVTILEHIPELKEDMLKTFKVLLQKLQSDSDIWSHRTNQLYANIIDF